MLQTPLGAGPKAAAQVISEAQQMKIARRTLISITIDYWRTMINKFFNE